MGCKYFSRQKIDEAGKTGVVIQKLVIFLLISEFLGLAFNFAIGNFSSLFGSLFTVFLLYIAFKGASTRNSRLLTLYFAVNVGLFVAFLVAILVIIVVVLVVFSGYTTSYSSYSTYSSYYPSSYYSSFYFPTSQNYATSDIYSTYYSSLYWGGETETSQESVYTDYFFPTENGGMLVFTGYASQWFYYAPSQIYYSFVSSLNSASETLIPALDLQMPTQVDYETSVPSGPDAMPPMTSTTTYYEYDYTLPIVGIVVSIIFVLYAIAVFACKVATIVLVFKMRRQLCRASLPVNSQPMKTFTPASTPAPNGGAYYIIVPQDAAMPASFPNMQQPFYYVQPNIQ